MQDIQKMTDAELVEAVAREVLGWDDVVHYTLDRRGLVRTHPDNIGIAFNPFTDMNDLQMVKDKFDDYQVRYRKGLYDVCVFNLNGVYGATRDNEARAWLEAALSAEREKG